MRTTAILCFSCLLSVFTLTSSARATEILPENTTDVTLTSAGLLASLGFSVAPTGTATVEMGSSPPVVMFPITGGTAVGSDLMIEHNGSDLSLSRMGTTVDVGDFLVNTMALVVDGFVSVNGGPMSSPVALFNIVPASPLELTLTSGAATALNGAFGVTVFEPGLEIGTVVTHPVLAPEAPTWVMLVGGFAVLAYATRCRRLRPLGAAA
jgi:hypothetical protein